MVDEVEIKNVGGRFGIASEATLAALVDTLSRGRNGVDQSARLERVARQASTRTIREENTERRGLLGGIADTSRGLTGLAKEAMTGGDRLGDFTEMVLGAGTALGELIRYTEGLTDAFRDLSTYGASFNNSLFDMRLAAAESEMAFDDFATLIRDNSRFMAQLGGTTSEGARQFGIFTRNLRTSRVGQELMGMGFTINEINDGLATYLDAQMMSGRRIELRDRQLIESSGEYLMQLDRLSKLTGKRREELAREMAQLAQDAGLRRQLNALDGENRENLEGVLTFVRSSMPGLASGFEDIMDGVAQTELGQLLQSQINGLGPLMQRAFRGEINEVDFIEQLKQFQPQINELQRRFSTEQIAAMRQAGGIAGEYAVMLDNLFELNRVLGINTEQYQLEADQRSRLTTLFGNFEQTVQTARGRLVTAFINSPAFAALERLGNRLLDLVSENGSIDGFSSGLDRIFDYFFGEHGAVTRTLEWFTDLISSPEFESDMNRFFETVRDITNRLVTYFIGTRTETIEPGTDEVHVDYVGGLFERIYNTFEDVFEGEKTILDVIYEGFENIFTSTLSLIREKIGPIMTDFLYGPEVEVREGPEVYRERQGGFLKTLTDGFWSVFETMQDQLVGFWEGPNGIELRNTISGFFENLVDNITDYITGGGSRTAQTIESGGTVSPGVVSGLINSVTGLNMGASLDAESFLAQAQRAGSWDPRSMLGLDTGYFGSSGYLSTVFDQMRESGDYETSREVKDEIVRALNSFVNQNYQGEDLETVRQYVQDVIMEQIEGLPEFATGTSGFENFGGQSMAALHGVEAVVPRNTPAGDFLDRYFTEDWQAKPQPNMEPVDGRGSNSQENLVKYLIQLNSTMVSVLAEIRRTNELEKQTLNSMRGLGGDMFRSV